MVTAHTGESTVAAVKTDPGPIDLILLDVDLTDGIDGIEATEKSLAARNTPRLLLLSSWGMSVSVIANE